MIMCACATKFKLHCVCVCVLCALNCHNFSQTSSGKYVSVLKSPECLSCVFSYKQWPLLVSAYTQELNYDTQVAMPRLEMSISMDDGEGGVMIVRVAHGGEIHHGDF